MYEDKKFDAENMENISINHVFNYYKIYES